MSKEALILVFYIKRELFEEEKIINHISGMVEESLNQKDVHAVSYIMPTDGDERVECINPVQISEADYSEIKETLDKLKKEFNIE